MNEWLGHVGRLDKIQSDILGSSCISKWSILYVL